MAQEIRDVMTQDVVALPTDTSLADASRAMRERDIGDVLVVDGDRLAGIVTDRDIVIRAIAEDRSPSDTTVGELATGDVTSLSPEDSVEDAIRIMREQAVRRIPVVENDRPVGIVSIGDLAVERDPNSALADISVADPDG
jgi:CBS domain-containing protein